MSWDIEAFKEKIEQQHAFPGPYVFKFIVPIALKEDIVALLPKGEISFKTSSKSNYVSVTLEAIMNSSDSVIDIYKEAHQIKGIVAL